MSALDDRPPPRPHPAGADSYELIQASDEFQALRHSLRRFAFPVTALFLGWYMLYVVMSAYARDFMGTKVVGNINVAYIFGLLQFLSTFLIAFIYSRHAQKNLDPTADRIRDRIEGTA